MRKFLLYCFLLMLMALPRVSFAEQAAEEELAPGFNLCMESATSAYFMTQCGNEAYAYWENKLSNRYKLLRSICSRKESQDKGIQKECSENLACLEKNGSEYIDSMRHLITLLSDDETGKMAGLDALGLKIDATKQQVKNFAVLPYFDAVDSAEEMFNHLAALWEHGAVQSFDVLTDEMLDNAVMAVYDKGNSPFDNTGLKLIHRENKQLFTGDTEKYDFALRRADAAKIAAYYFGRKALLKNLKGEYLYGMQGDLVLLCRGKIEDISARENGFAVKGALLCRDHPMAPEEEEKHIADMEVTFEKNMDYFTGDTDLPRISVRSVKITERKVE